MKTIANRGDYLNAVTDYAREWSNEVVITDGVRTETYTSCAIKITTPFSQDDLSMGQSFTKELDLTIKEPERTLIYNLATIKVYTKLKVGENFVTVQMGEYFPSEVTTNDDYFSLNIKAYDTMGKLDTPYVPQGSPETTAEIVSDIASQYGITVAGIVPNVPIDTIYEGTVAETLGWVAGLDGKNAIFNDNGHLVFRWYTEAKQDGGRWLDYPVTWAELSGKTWRHLSPMVKVSRTEQKERGANLNEGEFTIASITSGTEENPLTVGEGKGISFENPYMTAELLTTIGNRELGKKTAVGTVNTFGNPLLEVGDIVGVIDKQGDIHDFFISKMEWNLTGGCSCIITAIGNADAEIEFSNVSPMEKKITKVKSVLQGVVERFSNLINSLVGYYTITEENGVPTGWEIKDDLNNPQNMIKCSLGGLGISSNGGQTYQTAMTGEGIVADSITTGTMLADRIKGGTLELGGLNNEGGIFKMLDTDGTTARITMDNKSMVFNPIENNPVLMRWTGAISGDAQTGSLYSSGLFFNKNYVSPSNYDYITSYQDSYMSMLNKDGNNTYETRIYPSAITCKYNGTTKISTSTYSGNVTAVSFTNTSEEKTKEDIKPLGKALDIINKADICTYKIKDEAKKRGAREHIGMVIGDKYNTPDELIVETTTEVDGKVETSKGIDLYAMNSMLWKAVQELSTQVGELTKEVDKMRGGNNVPK